MTRMMSTCLCLVVLSVAAPAAAWQSEVHTGLAQLNPALWSVPGVAGSYNAILMGSDIAQACHQRHSMRTSQEWSLRVYWDLVCGSTEPDAGKGPLNVRNPSHQRDRIIRSLDAFDAALGQFRQAGPERNARAARRLGHSLHYLQDAVDPTKILRGDQDRLRERVAVHVNGLLDYKRREGRNHPELEARLDRWRNDAVRLMSPREVLDWVSRHQVDLADTIGRELNRPSPWLQLDNYLLHMIAIAVAAQERLVGLYLSIAEQPGPPPEGEERRSVDCSTTTKSGKDAPETITVTVGRGAGTATFSYEMYTVKDRMIVNYAGRTLLDTGCISGRKTVPLYLDGLSDQVTVVVRPACEQKGTQWNFRLECPRR